MSSAFDALRIVCFWEGESVARSVVISSGMCRMLRLGFSPDCLLVRGISVNLVRGWVYRLSSVLFG